MATFYPKVSASRQEVSQLVDGTSASAASAAFGSETYQILLVTTATGVQFRIDNGTPTALAASDTILPANIPMYFVVTPGQKVAVLGGIVSVTELS